MKPRRKRPAKPMSTLSDSHTVYRCGRKITVGFLRKLEAAQRLVVAARMRREGA